MQELIERRAALTALCEDCLQKYEGICPHPASRCVEFRTIKQLPAIDAEPVRHGRWKNIPGMNNTVFCSECLAAANKELAMKYKGCPFFLARMDGGADNDG